MKLNSTLIFSTTLATLAAISSVYANVNYPNAGIPTSLKLATMPCPSEILIASTDMQSMPGMSHHDSHSTSTSVATTKIFVITPKPLTVGQEATAILKLVKQDGQPMLLSDLKERHTQKIHLLINDPSLSDYHHVHPTPTNTPGEYSFTFTPSKPGSYRVWADLVPVTTDTQEYAITDIAAPTKGEPIASRSPSTSVWVDGLKYTVTFEKSILKAGKPVLGKLTITKSNGTLFKELEPIMGAYSHIVGFGEDFKTIAHIHPMGAEPKQPSDRGTGDLKFQLLSTKPGLMRLYVQVRVNGQDKFAPFTLEIQP